MLDLMAVNQDDAAAPLYIYVIHRILREMRIAQQVSGERFSYTKFKSLLLSSDLTPSQLAPLGQRLSVLESFMPLAAPKRKGKGSKTPPGSNWASEVSTPQSSSTCTNINTAWPAHYSRPLLSLYYTGNGMLLV